MSHEADASHEPAAPPEIPWSKLHPLTPVMHGGITFVVIIGVIIANLRDRFITIFFGREWVTEDDDYDPITLIIENGWILFALIGLLVLLLIIVGIGWLSWRFHSYRITQENVEMKQGILFRKHRRAPLLRIQAVNVQRPLLARALGLAKLQVQTAGQDGDLALSYLSHSVAKVVRKQILERVQHVQGNADATVDFLGQVHEPAETTIDRRAQDFIDFDIDAESARAGSLVRIPLGRLIGSVLLSDDALIIALSLIAIPIAAVNTSLAVLGTLIPLVIVFASLMVSRFNRGFNFTISRSQDGVRTGSGLTSTYTETIPRRRIHSIDVAQPMLWRLTGWWRIRVTTGGNITTQNNQNMFQNILLPVGTLEDVHRVLGLLLPAYDTPEDHAQLADAVVGSGEGFTTSGPKAKFLYWLQHRRFGVRVAHTDEPDATILMRRGRLVRRLTITPVARVQSIEVRRSPIRRLVDVADLRVHTVTGPVQSYVKGLATQDAQHWFDRLAPEIVTAMRHDQPPGYP